MKTQELLTALRRLVSSLPPGTALPGQRELCARFEVTTFTLHQTLRSLERENLVEVTPRKGIFVKERNAAAARVVQVVYLDNPQAMRIREYGLGAFVAVTSRQQTQCRVAHLGFEDLESFRAVLGQAAEDPTCPGVVVSGCVSPEVAEFLGTLKQPWVLFGDGLSLRPLAQLPIVTGDGFQGGQLAAQRLLAKGVERVVLVNFLTKPDWPWVCESRAGALSVLSERGAEVFLPASDCTQAPVEFEREVQEWARGAGPARVGILCRNRNVLHIATSIRRLFNNGESADLALMDLEQHPLELPDVDQVFCSMEELAEVSLRRLAAMRYGMDAPGRVRVSYKLLSRATPPLVAMPEVRLVSGVSPAGAPGVAR
jgi:hypothetical protein